MTLRCHHPALWLGLAAFFGSGLPAALAQEAASAEAADLVRGEVILRVPCLQDAGQSYALYLPTNYTPDRRWPILYAFDSGARGALPVKLFSAAAERLGYIVVGSNNARNGPKPPLAAAMAALWRDTHARLAIDDARVYATGVSGGTGPALALATRFGAGLIACAGALQPEDVPKLPSDFVWMGVAGSADFNFGANRKVVDALVGRGVVARLAVFEGAHSWPPADVAAHALEFLQVGAIRTGRAPHDEAFIARYVAAAKSRAEERAGERPDEAADEFAALGREVHGLIPVEGFKAEAKRLRETPQARKNVKRERALSARYERGIGELLRWRDHDERAGRSGGRGPAVAADEESDANALESDGTGVDLDRRLAQLRRDCEAQDREVRILAQRLLDGFYIATWQEAKTWTEAGGRERALRLYQRCAQARPLSAAPVYEEARMHAAHSDATRALATLRRAVALGFADDARLRSEPEWAALLTDPRFQELVEVMRARKG